MNLRELIKEKGVTHRWLMERMDLSQGTFYKYLDNPREMRVSHLMKMADLLNVPRGSMFTIVLKLY